MATRRKVHRAPLVVVGVELKMLGMAHAAAELAEQEALAFETVQPL